MAFELPRLPPTQPDWPTFQAWWQQVVERIETQVNDILAVQADIIAAQAAADAAHAAANAAQTTADTAQTAAADAADTALQAAREAARINSYPNPGASIVTASDMGGGAGARITIANHVRVYPVEGGIDVPDVAITGATINGLAYSTRYYVYYDDTTLSDDTPAFQATVTSANAQVGAAAGRHFVGYVTTPASGAGSTTGDGGGTPGGGGGGGSGGGQIP